MQLGSWARARHMTRYFQVSRDASTTCRQRRRPDVVAESRPSCAAQTVSTASLQRKEWAGKADNVIKRTMHGHACRGQSGPPHHQLGKEVAQREARGLAGLAGRARVGAARVRRHPHLPLCLLRARQGRNSYTSP